MCLSLTPSVKTPVPPAKLVIHGNLKSSRIKDHRVNVGFIHRFLELSGSFPAFSEVLDVRRVGAIIGGLDAMDCAVPLAISGRPLVGLPFLPGQ
jgi:hypothetical protein